MRNRLYYLILIIFGIVSLKILNSTYKEEPNVYNVFTSNEVAISESKLGYLFDGKGINDLIIFYPGAKVEEIAYAPLMLNLAENGIDTYIVKMPFNLALFGKKKADKVIKEYSYKSYYMAGHSLGGAMASSYTATTNNDIKALILLASYSTKKIPDGVKVLSIYGSNDGVLNIKKYNKYKKNIESNLEEHIIQGANHANFGNYGNQKKDKNADISKETQQKITSHYITEFINNL